MHCPLKRSNSLLAHALMPDPLNRSIKSVALLAMVSFTVFSSKVYLCGKARAKLSATLNTGIHLMVSMSLEVLSQSILRTEQCTTLAALKFLIKMDSYMFKYLCSSRGSNCTLFTSKSALQVHICESINIAQSRRHYHNHIDRGPNPHENSACVHAAVRQSLPPAHIPNRHQKLF